MAGWSAGYVTEVGYTYGFYRELTPNLLAFAALQRGLNAPGLDGTPLRVLELGCGQGESANIIAATRPEIDYTAIDFNPAHIAGAESLAQAAGSTNLHLREASFEQLAAEADLGTFDLITLHGIYTWVSAENREHILTIARRALRPGGVLYVSYNCFPGWTPVMPIRRLLTDIAASKPNESIFSRLDAGLGLFKRLAEVNAGYITNTPGLRERIDKIETLQRNYVAHEYLNGEWTIFHFADVAADMARAKLNFGASAHVSDTIDPINFSPEQLALLNEQSDPILREGLRDLIQNQQFRRDIFVRGSLPLRSDEARSRWLDQRFALTRRAEDIPRRVPAPVGEVELAPEVYEPILRVLDQGPRTARELLAEPALASLGWPRLQQALVILVGTNVAHPALPLDGEAERVARADRLNGALLQRARSSVNHNFLASPVIGAGIQVDRFAQLTLLAQREGQGHDPVSFIWNCLQSEGQRVMRDGKALESEADNRAEISKSVEAFLQKQASVLTHLKVR